MSSHVDRQTRPEPPLHLSGGGAAGPASEPGGHFCPENARRYLPEHRHPGGEHYLVLHRLFAQGHGVTHRHDHGARAYHHGQRHRAYRIAIAERHRGGEGLFSSLSENRHGGGPGNGRFADAAAAIAPGHHPAADPAVQRLERANPAVEPEQQNAFRADPERSFPEHDPPPADEYPGRGDSLSLWRQATLDHGRYRHSQAAILRPDAQ